MPLDPLEVTHLAAEQTRTDEHRTAGSDTHIGYEIRNAHSVRTRADTPEHVPARLSEEEATSARCERRGRRVASKQEAAERAQRRR